MVSVSAAKAKAAQAGKGTKSTKKAINDCEVMSRLVSSTLGIEHMGEVMRFEARGGGALVSVLYRWDTPSSSTEQDAPPSSTDAQARQAPLQPRGSGTTRPPTKKLNPVALALGGVTEALTATPTARPCSTSNVAKKPRLVINESMRRSLSRRTAR